MALIFISSNFENPRVPVKVWVFKISCGNSFKILLKAILTMECTTLDEDVDDGADDGVE